MSGPIGGLDLAATVFVKVRKDASQIGVTATAAQQRLEKGRSDDEAAPRSRLEFASGFKRFGLEWFRVRARIRVRARLKPKGGDVRYRMYEAPHTAHRPAPASPPQQLRLRIPLGLPGWLAPLHDHVR